LPSPTNGNNPTSSPLSTVRTVELISPSNINNNNEAIHSSHLGVHMSPSPSAGWRPMLTTTRLLTKKGISVSTTLSIEQAHAFGNPFISFLFWSSPLLSETK
jgi:hypothetical protein